MNRNTYDISPGPGSRRTFAGAGLVGGLMVFLGVAGVALGQYKWLVSGLLDPQIAHGKSFSPLTMPLMESVCMLLVFIPMLMITGGMNPFKTTFVWSRKSLGLLIGMAFVNTVADTLLMGRTSPKTPIILQASSSGVMVLAALATVRLLRPEPRRSYCHGAVVFSFLFAAGAPLIAIIEPYLKAGLDDFTTKEAAYTAMYVVLTILKGIVMGLYARYYTRFVNCHQSPDGPSADQIYSGQAPLLYYQQRSSPDDQGSNSEFAVNNPSAVLSGLVFVMTIARVIFLPLCVPLLSIPLFGLAGSAGESDSASMSVKNGYQMFKDGFTCFEGGATHCDDYHRLFIGTTCGNFLIVLGQAIASLQHPSLAVVMGIAGSYAAQLVAGHVHWFDIGPGLSTHQNWQLGGAIAMAVFSFLLLFVWDINTIGEADGNSDEYYNPQRLSGGSYRNSTDGYGAMSKAAV